MFHLSAYTASLGLVTNSDTPALSDGWLTIQNGHFIYQKDMRLMFVGSVGVLMTNLRLNTPHYRAINIPSFPPVGHSGVPGTLGRMVILPPPFLTIPAIDEVAAEITTSGAGPTQCFAFVGAGDGNMNSPQGDIYTCRLTGAITAVANQWTRGAMTFDQVLPAGSYAVIGMACTGASILAARLRFQQAVMMPGCLSANVTAGGPDEWRFRMGRLGEWGRFANTAQPSLEILCAAADTTQTIYLDLVKV